MLTCAALMRSINLCSMELPKLFGSLTVSGSVKYTCHHVPPDGIGWNGVFVGNTGAVFGGVGEPPKIPPGSMPVRE